MRRSENRAGWLARLADLAYRRRGRVVLVWVVLLAAAVGGFSRFAGDFEVEFGTPGSESKRAADLVAEHFPGGSVEFVNVVWEDSRGAHDPRVEARVRRFLEQAGRVEGIGEAQPSSFSRDRTIGLTRLELERPFSQIPTDSGKRLIELAEAASSNGLRVELGGGLIRNSQEGASPELAGLAAGALILLVAFGSVVAVGLPLAIAIFSLGISATLIGVLAAFVDMPDFAPAVAGLIGIGVGIDYALLILTRFRTALTHNRDPHAALVESVATAGRSVLVAGGTVVISLLGLFFIGISFLRGIALSASLAVLIVMAASVTLLPALLAFAGRRVDRLRIPGLGRALRTDGNTLAGRWSRLIQRRPWPAAAVGAAILVTLAAPVLGLRFGFPDEGNDRAETTTRRAYELVSEGFGPGANGPLVLVADLARGTSAAGLSDLGRELSAVPGVAFAGEPRPSPDGAAAVLTVIPTTAPQDDSTTELVRRLRDDVLPRSLERSRTTVYVGGVTAAFIDQSNYVDGRLPVFVAGVVVLSFLLLLVAFRAPLIALKAGVMNLLSIGAAYGVIALFSGGGFAGRLVGIETDTPIPPFMPVMMFAILFGLSMDYEVFLLSRVREEYLGHGDTGRAVADGLAKTARVITAAAAIMVAVFLAFVLSNEVFLKLMGLGMAAAILVDATIVRMVLVPAVMQLMGRANWWLPPWLDRLLPRLDVEPAASPVTERR
jgi:putative drug exporter of the RND superfamily